MNEEHTSINDDNFNQSKKKKKKHRHRKNNDIAILECLEKNTDIKSSNHEQYYGNSEIQNEPKLNKEFIRDLVNDTVHQSNDSHTNNKTEYLESESHNELKSEKSHVKTDLLKSSIMNDGNDISPNESENRSSIINEVKSGNIYKKSESIETTTQTHKHQKKIKKKIREKRDKSTNSDTVQTNVDYTDNYASNSSLHLPDNTLQSEIDEIGEFPIPRFKCNSVDDLLSSASSLYRNRSSEQEVEYSRGNKENQINDKREMELRQFFPNKTAKIMIITWNMAGISEYPENFNEFIDNTNCKEMCDLYLFSFQETTNNKIELLTRIQSTFGTNYVIYDYIENKKIFGVLVGHKKFIWHIGVIGKKILSTRITTVTKGVAAISFYLFGSKILFLASHFSTPGFSDIGKNDLRIEDYKSIHYSKDLIDGLSVSNDKTPNNSNILSDYFDYTFWAGDLNFRLNLDDSKVRHIIKQDCDNTNFIKIENLLEHDELNTCQIHGISFGDFQEGRIKFLPTYKFIIGKNEFDQIRIPAYTDRILFKSIDQQGIDYLYYSSIESCNFSDHKPVRAIIEINIEPQIDEYLKSGKFHNEIYDKCNNKPINTTIQSKTCSIQ